MRKSVLSGAAALFLLAGGAYAADKAMDCCKDCKCCEKKADDGHKGRGSHDGHQQPAPAPKG
ncbi:MAG TPA: hypothetical protein VD929_09795 [Caulobacteraceae bacterium]|nr:hypothetical protein [Caulobacteraceae bacterium]